MVEPEEKEALEKGVARRRISRSGQIAAESGQPEQEVTDGFPLWEPWERNHLETIWNPGN